MLNFILTNFKEMLNLEENANCINTFKLDQKINIISIDNLNANNDKESISHKLDNIYEKMEKNQE
jgi:hypothetical protein